MSNIPNTVLLAINIFKQYAVGETIEARFANVIKPKHVADACFMTTNEDEQFRAAVGAVMLSYGTDSPEFAQMEAEMRAISQLSAFIQAAQAGLQVTVPEPEDGAKPIGLLRMWHGRER